MYVVCVSATNAHTVLFESILNFVAQFHFLNTSLDLFIPNILRGRRAVCVGRSVITQFHNNCLLFLHRIFSQIFEIFFRKFFFLPSLIQFPTLLYFSIKKLLYFFSDCCWQCVMYCGLFNVYYHSH